MPAGPGKYDDLATFVREQTSAVGVALIIIGGVKGHGFSVQALTQTVSAELPRLLRQMADQIEKSQAR